MQSIAILQFCGPILHFDGLTIVNDYDDQRGIWFCVAIAQLVSGSRDGSIRVWDLRSGESLYGMYGYTGFMTALQFEKNILISDGTNNVLGYHDFADADGINITNDDLDC